MTKWEYMEVIFRTFERHEADLMINGERIRDKDEISKWHNPRYRIHELNLLGQDGWELIEIKTQYENSNFYFKRPL